jgi:hypothetical protein
VRPATQLLLLPARTEKCYLPLASYDTNRVARSERALPSFALSPTFLLSRVRARLVARSSLACRTHITYTQASFACSSHLCPCASDRADRHRERLVGRMPRWPPGSLLRTPGQASGMGTRQRRLQAGLCNPPSVLLVTRPRVRSACDINRVLLLLHYRWLLRLHPESVVHAHSSAHIPLSLLPHNILCGGSFAAPRCHFFVGLKLNLYPVRVPQYATHTLLNNTVRQAEAAMLRRQQHQRQPPLQGKRPADRGSEAAHEGRARSIGRGTSVAVLENEVARRPRRPDGAAGSVVGLGWLVSISEGFPVFSPLGYFHGSCTMRIRGAGSNAPSNSI